MRSAPADSQAESPFTTRPIVTGNHGVVAAGHYLAAQAGARMLDRGGNAIDAGVAAGFVLALVKPHHNGLGGEAPMLIGMAGGKDEPHRVVAVSGQGPAPQAATLGWFSARGIDAIPGDGFLPLAVPGAFGAWCTALTRYGTLDLATVMEPAIELADDGYVVDPLLATYFAKSAARFADEWPSSADAFFPEGRPPVAGERLRQPSLAMTLKRLADAALRERRGGREASIDAAVATFYRGEVAERMVAFQRSAILDGTGARHAGLLVLDDLASYQTRVEEPVSYRYHGVEVFKCGPWTQGPVFLQQLALLSGFRLDELQPGSAEYIHLLVEVAKLAFADREEHYGDPRFVDVPLELLLSDAYNAARRALIHPDRAAAAVHPGAERRPPASGGGALRPQDGDTTHVDAADRFGNLLSATPSGGWFQASPVVPGLGFPLGTRAQQFTLEPGRANSLAPGKRPRTTLTPSIAFRDGRPWLAFGTPGGDYQDQWTLQFLLNVIHFGMDLQQAVDAPTFHTDHFPSSFYPHSFLDRRVVVESRIDEAAREALSARGHDVIAAGAWSNGQVTAVEVRRDGALQGAASPRTLVPYVVGR